MSATVRVNQKTHRKLKCLAEESGESMQMVLKQVVESLRRARFLERASQSYAELKGDKAAWAAEQNERREWDKTVGDGLHKDSK